MKTFLFVWALILPVVGFAQCKTLRKTVDKFSGETRVKTDATEPTVVIREIKNGDEVYFLNLTAPGEARANLQGVSVLLSDGSRMDWPGEAVEVSFSSFHPRWDSNLTARAFVRLTAGQVEALQKSRITDYKLSVYPWTVKEKFGVSLQKEIGCLVSTDPQSVKLQ